MHAAILIDGKAVFLADDFLEYCGKSSTPKALGGSSVTIHRYVADCDAAIKRAEEAGATVTMSPEDMFWGDRYGLIEDPFGHTWSFATHLSDPTPEQMQATMKEMFEQHAPHSA
jgi:PhnB protein